uniref:Uncharacterized protein n=1 Tax=Rhizophora mucronata TaxID=61149 RepID=A0A2P2J6X9_RHIMU
MFQKKETGAKHSPCLPEVLPLEHYKIWFLAKQLFSTLIQPCWSLIHKRP